MATDNLQLNYLTINQAQKEEVFNDNMNILDQEFSGLDIRITLLENGGTGGTSYDDTELRNRITQNESDIEALEQTDISLTSDIESLQTLTGQHSTQIGSLQTSNTNMLNRLVDVEDSDVLQDSEINDLEDRVIVLENSGGSGYNDTELRNRITTNEDDIVSLNTFYTDLSDRVDTIESVNSTQNTTLDGYGIRITDLEQASQFDPTPIENRLTDVEQDLSIVKTNQTNIQNDFQDLETNVNTFDTRITTNESDIDSLQLSDSQQDTDISNLDTRVTTLENSSGSSYDDTELRGRITNNESDIDALQLSDSQQDTDISSLDNRVTTLENSSGISYDDTELRGRITTNESDIDALQLSDAQQDTDISNLQTTTQDHETRISSLESGGGTGGGDMPQTGEIRRFSRAHIPTDWYELSKYESQNSNMFYTENNNLINTSVLTSNSDNIKHTSSGKTFFTRSGFGLYEVTKNGLELLNSNFTLDGSDTSIFNKKDSNILNVFSFESNTEIFYGEYDLTNNNYTSSSYTVDNLGYTTSSNRRFTVIDKAHENIYRFFAGSTDDLYIIKFNIPTLTANSALYQNIADFNFLTLSLIYFDNNGDIVISQRSDSNYNNNLKINKDTLALTENVVGVLNSEIEFVDIYGSSAYSEILWFGDNQLLIDANADKFCLIENYTSYKSEDLFNINILPVKANLSKTVFDLFFDENYNLFYYNSNTSLVSFNTIDGIENIVENKVVDCIYNVPQ